MSVIVRDEQTKQLKLCVKGSAEAVQSLSQHETGKRQTHLFNNLC